MGRANALSGKDWLKNSISIWSDIAKTKEEKALKHPAAFPAALPLRLIQSFTTEEEGIVLDPFMGIGTTLVAAALSGKHGIGFELSAEYISIAESRLSNTAHTIYPLDSRNMGSVVTANSVDLILTSPPYWDILRQNRTADYKDIRNYGDRADDLGNISDYHQFIEELGSVFSAGYEALKPGGYCIVIVMDIRKKSRFYPLHSDIAIMMQQKGYIYDDLIIWDRRPEYNNFKPLGYPYKFRINKAHEYILIFQKPA